jgi:hypothetical protein
MTDKKNYATYFPLKNRTVVISTVVHFLPVSTCFENSPPPPA